MPKYKQENAHTLIANLCVELAQAAYEELASRSDDFYKVNKDRKHFIRLCAPTLKVQAKQLLTEMLGHSDVTDEEKAKIYEALVLDAQLPKGTAIDPN